MLRVSLIVATLGERPDDIRALLRSLIPQVRFISDVIVVDQHPDPGRLPAILHEFRDVLPTRHVRSERGLSRARNHGLTFATGGLVAFPDDDCVYPDGLLEWVVNWFESNVEYDILAVGARDAAGVPSGNRWPQDSCDIKPLNAFRTTFSSSLFLCTDLAQSAKFDVQLGLGAGTPFGSGEETDYVLRLLRRDARGRFDRSRHIVHPRRDMLSGTASASRAQAYGFGMGHVLRLNSLRALWISFIAYNLARAGLVLFRGKLEASRLCLAQTKGLWRGFRAPDSAPAEGSSEHDRARRLGVPGASDHQLIQFPHPQDALCQEPPAQAVLNGATVLHSGNEGVQLYDRSSLGQWQ
ncbi:MAG: glycosyltransferase family 2 protein [Terracidiphilus sp.]|jgi:glycosyltransferase involved in cell wall biosynthesis